VKNRVLFLAAVLVSLTMPVLADEVGFKSGTVISSGATGGAVAGQNGVPGAILFDGALAGAHPWTPRGNGQNLFGSMVEDSFDASSRRSFSSIVKFDDGIISISVPEPGTMATLAIGLAVMIGCLMGDKRSNPKRFLH
jgi:hypothetical protein